MFKKTLGELREYLKERDDKCKVINADDVVDWKMSEGNKILLPEDSAYELGYPTKSSVYFIVLLDEEDQINDGRITVVGNDIPELKEKNNPFGQIILIKGKFNESNIHDRYVDLDLVRKNVYLDGYVFRVRPDRGREYVRVSKEAAQKGINFKTVGSAMIKKYKEKKYVNEVEIIFITNEEDIQVLVPTVKKMMVYEDKLDRTIRNLMFFQYMEAEEGQLDK